MAQFFNIDNEVANPDSNGLYSWLIVRAGGGQSQFASIKSYGDIVDQNGNILTPITAGDGISVVAGVVSARLKASGGLTFDTGELKLNLGDNSINELGDVTVTAPQVADTIKYNGSVWVNEPEFMNDLGDVTITNPQVGDSVMYNGSQFVNMPMYMPIGEVYGGGDAVTTYSIPLTIQSQWYDVAFTGSTFVSNNADFGSNNFDSPSDGRIRWINANTVWFHTAFSASLSVSSSNQRFELALFKNGVIVAGSVIDKDFTGNNNYDSCAFHKVLEIAQNDYLNVCIRCISTGGVTATFSNLNIVLVSGRMI